MGALSGLRLTTARLGGSAPPALADRLLQVEADLLCRIGDVERAGEVLAGLRGPATASSARAVARLHLSTGDLAAAEEVLAQFPDDGATVRGRVEGAVLRSLIAATQDRAVALSRLEDALLAAAPLGMRRPFLVEAARPARPARRQDRSRHRRSPPSPSTCCAGCRAQVAADRRPYWSRR